jgi:hypothetical protein
MRKYHIAKNGKVAKCKATKIPCPLGGDNEHFSSKEIAQEYIDNQNRKKYGILAKANDTSNSNKIESVISQPIKLPIKARGGAKGNPKAMVHYKNISLNSRQQKLLDKLPKFDSRIIVKKKDVNLRDLVALTVATAVIDEDGNVKSPGIEFAMFTRGQERLIIRGNEKEVNVKTSYAKILNAEGYRWSGHTHPGFADHKALPSDDDVEILKEFTNQKHSVVLNSMNVRTVFCK